MPTPEIPTEACLFFPNSLIIHQFTHLSKDPSDLIQNGTQEKTPLSETDRNHVQGCTKLCLKMVPLLRFHFASALYTVEKGTNIGGRAHITLA